MSEKNYRLIEGALQYVDRIIQEAEKNGYNIIIWGFGRAGKYLKYLIEICGGKVDYIIDKEYAVNLPYDASPRVYKPSLLRYIDRKVIILSCIKNYDEIVDEICSNNKSIVEKIVDVRSVLGSSITDYLKNEYVKLDFSSTNEPTTIPDNSPHEPFAHASSLHLFSEVRKLEDDIALFDYGCGKGAALISAYVAGIDVLGGIEYDSSTYEICLSNMGVLGLDAKISCGNACDYHDIDEYNVFFLYNPFSGQVFEKTIINIEESVERKPRKTYLIYANPFCHENVIKRGKFHVYKHIDVDLYDPIANVYLYGK